MRNNQNNENINTNTNANANANTNLRYLKKVITDSVGEDFWNGLCDVVTTERPKIDIYENEGFLLILAEIPGLISAEDVNISITSNRLNIKGVSKDKYQSQDKKTLKKIKGECLFGSFDRVVELPFKVDNERIEAIYENGILEIKIPKSEHIVENTIKIQFKK